ncbi:hypothetical protein BGZ73_002571 [Actinomortierella ambigua]|nr:hypothetical protein BGZ73_002571 [Actinomortierella ambigua]
MFLSAHYSIGDKNDEEYQRYMSRVPVVVTSTMLSQRHGMNDGSLLDNHYYSQFLVDEIVPVKRCILYIQEGIVGQVDCDLKRWANQIHSDGVSPPSSPN